MLGRVLGPATGEGNEMSLWILKANGEVVPRRSHRPLKVDEQHSEVEKKKRTVFNQVIERRHGPAIRKAPVNSDIDEDFTEYEDDFETPRDVPDIEESVNNKGMALNQSPAYDLLLNAEVSIQLEEQGRATGVVRRRERDSDGNVSGRLLSTGITTTLSPR